MLARVLLHELDVIAVRHKANILAVVLACVAEAELLRQLADLRLVAVAQRKFGVRKLPLRHRVQHIALVLARVHALFEQPATGLFILLNAGIVTRDNVIQAVLLGKIQQLVELHKAVAVNAGIGRAACLIGADKLADDLLLKIQCKIQYLIRNIQLKRNLTCVLDILFRTAGAEITCAEILVAVQPHGRAHAAEVRLPHQVSRDRAVYAAAHRYECGLLFCVLHQCRPLFRYIKW